MTDFDTDVFLYIHGLSGRSALLDALGVFFATYLAYLWILVFVGAALLPGAQKAERRAASALAAAAALVARFALKTAIVLAYPRTRPFLALPDVRPIISTPVWENFQSFPSGHALIFFSIASVIFCFNKKIGAIAFAAAALMGAARVYAGVHWPSDILAGAALGALAGWATYRLYTRHKSSIDDRLLTLFRVFAIN